MCQNNHFWYICLLTCKTNLTKRQLVTCASTGWLSVYMVFRYCVLGSCVGPHRHEMFSIWDIDWQQSNGVECLHEPFWYELSGLQLAMDMNVACLFWKSNYSLLNFLMYTNLLHVDHCLAILTQYKLWLSLWIWLSKLLLSKFCVQLHRENLECLVLHC